MARKRPLSTLDTSIAYEAVGLDLAKEDTAIAAFGPDHEGPYLIGLISLTVCPTTSSMSFWQTWLRPW